MAWKIEFSDSAIQQLRKLDRALSRRILGYLSERVAVLDDPRTVGKRLSGPLGGLWRYRVGDYRVLCDIQDGLLLILVLRVGNRKNVYRR